MANKIKATVAGRDLVVSVAIANGVVPLGSVTFIEFETTSTLGAIDWQGEQNTSKFPEAKRGSSLRTYITQATSAEFEAVEDCVTLDRVQELATGLLPEEVKEAPPEKAEEQGDDASTQG